MGTHVPYGAYSENACVIVCIFRASLMIAVSEFQTSRGDSERVSMTGSSLSDFLASQGHVVTT
jgi:hypothetical protein